MDDISVKSAISDIFNYIISIYTQMSMRQFIYLLIICTIVTTILHCIYYFIFRKDSK
jgi:Na+/H+ antiporter NhaD/arsenite permease-like protein